MHGPPILSGKMWKSSCHMADVFHSSAQMNHIILQELFPEYSRWENGCSMLPEQCSAEQCFPGSIIFKGWYRNSMIKWVWESMRGIKRVQVICLQDLSKPLQDSCKLPISKISQIFPVLIQLWAPIFTKISHWTSFPQQTHNTCQ